MDVTAPDSATPPSGKPAMFQSWRNLLFLHWEVPPEAMAATLPEGLVPHLFEGRAYLGVVPFSMKRIRPRGLPPVWWISDFLEMNVRTYVLGPGGVPGVWFHSLDTNRRVARILGRGFFHLAYFDAKMRAFVDGEGFMDYRARRLGADAEAQFRYRARGEFRTAVPGSWEEFLLERYRLFSWNARKRKLRSGRVQHVPYEYAEAEVPEWSGLPVGWNGMRVPEGPPVYACVARDVEVSVFGIEDA